MKKICLLPVMLLALSTAWAQTGVSPDTEYKEFDYLTDKDKAMLGQEKNAYKRDLTAEFTNHFRKEGARLGVDPKDAVGKGPTGVNDRAYRLERLNDMKLKRDMEAEKVRKWKEEQKERKKAGLSENKRISEEEAMISIATMFDPTPRQRELLLQRLRASKVANISVIRDPGAPVEDQSNIEWLDVKEVFGNYEADQPVRNVVKKKKKKISKEQQRLIREEQKRLKREEFLRKQEFKRAEAKAKREERIRQRREKAEERRRALMSSPYLLEDKKKQSETPSVSEKPMDLKPSDLIQPEEKKEQKEPWMPNFNPSTGKVSDAGSFKPAVYVPYQGRSSLYENVEVWSDMETNNEIEAEKKFPQLRGANPYLNNTFFTQGSSPIQTFASATKVSSVEISATPSKYVADDALKKEIKELEKEAALRAMNPEFNELQEKAMKNLTPEIMEAAKALTATKPNGKKTKPCTTEGNCSENDNNHANSETTGPSSDRQNNLSGQHSVTSDLAGTMRVPTDSFKNSTEANDSDVMRLYTIYISESMGEENIRNLLKAYAGDNSVRFVLRGIKGGTINESLRWIMDLARTIEPTPTIEIDPEAFKSNTIDKVPAMTVAEYRIKKVSDADVLTSTFRRDMLDAVSGKLPETSERMQNLVDGLKTLKEKPTSSLALKVFGVTNKSWADRKIEEGSDVNQGTRGTTYAIAERDLEELAKERILKIDWNAKKEEAIKRYWENRSKTFIKLPRATVDSVRRIDPTIVLTQDVRDARGKVLLSKGQTFNPFDRSDFTQIVIVFDGSDSVQIPAVELLISQAKERKIPVKLIASEIDATKGWDGFTALRKRLGENIFLLTPEIKERFELRVTPSIISGDNKAKMLVVEERRPRILMKTESIPENVFEER